MKFLSGEETADFLEDLIYLDTQVSDKGLDLTVSSIYKLTERGELDFGGGERKDGELREIEPELRDEEDDYGWWELEKGTYLMEYNESLTEDCESAYIQPLLRLTRNSAVHPSKFVEQLDLVPLTVGDEGLSIKENSRVSRIFVVKD